MGVFFGGVKETKRGRVGEGKAKKNLRKAKKNLRKGKKNLRKGNFNRVRSLFFLGALLVFPRCAPSFS